VKTILNTLNPYLERWDDPGDYPNSLAGGPLPSYDFVAFVDGEIVVEAAPAEVGLEPDETMEKALPEYIADNPGEVKHDVSGLTVSRWGVGKVEGNRVTLTVEEFECEVPGPPEDDYRERD
jgi:hypothetical protein